MRVLVFLLILGNLLFWVWTQGVLGSSPNPDAVRVQQQLLADQVRIVSRDEPPADVPAVASKQAKAEKRSEPEECLSLPELAAADLGRLEGLVKDKFPAFRAERNVTAASSGGYWVFIPPLPNKAEADRKASELKKLKLPEFFVVQEPAANRFAISLGIFSTREAAEARLDELRGKGVRNAKVGERPGKSASSALEMRGPESLADELREALADWAPKSKPTACRAGR